MLNNYFVLFLILTAVPVCAQKSYGCNDPQAVNFNTALKIGEGTCLYNPSIYTPPVKYKLEGEIGDSHVGLQARLMSQSMRKLTGSISRSKTCSNRISRAMTACFPGPIPWV